MKKFIFFCLISVCILPGSKAQKPSFKDRIYVGGNIGASFGGLTYVEVAPLVGYRFTEKFSAGPTLKYQFLRINKISANNYGGGVFSRYLVFDNLFLHAEYEYLSRDLVYIDAFTGRELGRERIAVNSVFAGGGYRQYLGQRAAFDLMLLYNLNDTPSSPYPNPIIRMGISVGL